MTDTGTMKVAASLAESDRCAGQWIARKGGHVVAHSPEIHHVMGDLERKRVPVESVVVEYVEPANGYRIY